MTPSLTIPLADAVPETCGSKAATLGALLRAGMAVPDGFVVPFRQHPAAHAGPPVPATLRRDIGRALATLGDPAVAVRSSASDEDGATASAAGQYASTLAVRGVDDVVTAIEASWESLSSSCAAGYRSRTGSRQVRPRMAVLVQRHIDADVSGVLFTPAEPDGEVRIEAVWGLGPAVVEGVVTPDAYAVGADGSVRRVIGAKTSRVDRTAHGGVSVREVHHRERGAATLDDGRARHLAAWGRRVAALRGDPQDVEWAFDQRAIWLLQSRPVTAPLPPMPGARHAAAPATLHGAPGALGTACGTARIVRHLDDLGRVRVGDILVCPRTDPAWTPLFSVVAAVVTQTGGALSHAAIVAREHGIPAVLGVPDALGRIHDGAQVTVDGTDGSLVVHPAPPTDEGD